MGSVASQGSLEVETGSQGVQQEGQCGLSHGAWLPETLQTGGMGSPLGLRKGCSPACTLRLSRETCSTLQASRTVT